MNFNTHSTSSLHLLAFWKANSAVWHIQGGRVGEREACSGDQITVGALSPTWMTSPAKGVYSYTKISLVGTWTTEGSNEDMIFLKNIILIWSASSLMKGLLMLLLFYSWMHQWWVAAAVCCQGTLVFGFCLFNYTKCPSRKETQLRQWARIRFPSAWGSSVFTTASQLIKLGNKQRSTSSSVIALKKEFMFPSGSIRDTQNKTLYKAGLHRERVMMLELKSFTLR